MDLLLDEVQVLEDEANNMHRASLSNGSWKVRGLLFGVAIY